MSISAVPKRSRSGSTSCSARSAIMPDSVATMPSAIGNSIAVAAVFEMNPDRSAPIAPNAMIVR
jgi:hypothetical protein